ncbi:LLM class F420-dependent oxidoreductase [Yinghuangia seranimata]|uniref:LLM class F420-dependent oxidoreductase n=1 Tax=Yinghuangia seranimata TaxID=408067 RepID=UPI00248CF29A|nr:LLM class F420-dependent oxidoreductase [Yinghuangia seranimata]MDI2131104.1 LLM class F420-dependent oxidoreductase [Yinghuangia seranimata]
MRFGLTMFATDLTISITEIAVAAEERGFASLFVSEHTHLPTSRRSNLPMFDELPVEYGHTLDPLIALTAAAGATRTLRLGTGVCLLAQREPIVTAKAIASLDLLSGGRFDFGVGFGWNVEEAEDHQVAWSARRAMVRERVLAMRGLWRDEIASYDGEHVRFAPSWCWPKPVQAGGPPVLLGGMGGPVLARHIAEYADGWLPVGAMSVEYGLPLVRRACEAVGRDPAGLRVVPCGGFPPTPAEVARFHELGVIDEVVLTVPHAPADTVLRTLDHYVKAYVEA